MGWGDGWQVGTGRGMVRECALEASGQADSDTPLLAVVSSLWGRFALVTIGWRQKEQSKAAVGVSVPTCPSRRTHQNPRHASPYALLPP